MPSDISPIPQDLSDSLPADESCQLLGPTALVVQAALGVFVILSLVYKRHREPQKRPWRIWIFDVSKQVVGQMFVHGANILASDIISQYTSGNACVFYFLHILLDTTLGVGIIYVIHHALTDLCSEKFHWKGFESGVYGSPPSIKFWGRQAALYVLALTSMKIIVITIIILVPGIFGFGEWLLSWTRVGSDDSLQVIFTMGIFPIIMNVLQFWLIDSIVKASATPVALNEDSLYDPRAQEPLFRASSDDEDDDYRHNDIEHARPHRRSRSPDIAKSSTDSTPTPEEYKSGTTSDEPVDHSYPPSLTNSTISSSSQSRPARNLLKNAKRRAAPAPLNVHTDYPRAVNSPGVVSSAQPVMPIPIVPMLKVKVEVATEDPAADAWAETWDDEGDWADRVGEEEWTGRRIEHRKDTLRDVWNRDPTIQVS